jgi:hypothetical protein
MNERKKAIPLALVIHGGFPQKLHNRAEDIVMPPPLIICGGFYPQIYNKRRKKDDGT